MARYRGVVGFALSTEQPGGVWTDQITERTYRGDELRANAKWQPTSELNDNLTISNRISIVADSFALENLGYMRYLTWHKCRFKITNVEVQYPRLILSIGGVYNGPTPT